MYKIRLYAQTRKSKYVNAETDIIRSTSMHLYKSKSFFRNKSTKSWDFVTNVLNDLSPSIGLDLFAASQTTVLHMKGFSQTESPIFVILCVLCFQRHSFLTFIALHMK